ncbi:hypothetical protein REPUB_Repub13aG0102000 [Reevesia pubescens]
MLMASPLEILALLVVKMFFETARALLWLCSQVPLVIVTLILLKFFLSNMLLMSSPK